MKLVANKNTFPEKGYQADGFYALEKDSIYEGVDDPMYNDRYQDEFLWIRHSDGVIVPHNNVDFYPLAELRDKRIEEILKD